MRSLNRTRYWLFCGILAALLSSSGNFGTRSVAQDAEKEAGVFRGQVILEGDVPTLEPAATVDSDGGKDLKLCGVTAVPNEKLIVDPESKGIANVFVYLLKAPVGMPADPEKAKIPDVKFETKGCQFVPHALLLRTDQTALIHYQDCVGHNAHFYPVRNTVFGAALSKSEEKIVSRTFKLPERQPLQVKCDVHPWMNAWWLVLDHPFAAITDAKGRFRVAELPAGEHEFVVWHESYGFIDRKVVVKIDGQQSPAAVTIKADVAKFKL